MSFYNKVLKVWKDVAPQDPGNAIPFEIEAHKKILSLFQAGPSYYFVFNVNKGEFMHISPEIKDILGYDANELSAYEFVNKIHPEDQGYFIAFEEKLVNFFRALHLEQIPKYKIQYDFRVADKTGKYRQILHQMIIIQYDDNKNLERSLGVHSDITHIKYGGIPKLSFLGYEDEPSYYEVPTDITVFTPRKKKFTHREEQILRLIIEGATSAKISEELCISVHTVNAHRKNILKKSGCDTVTELISKTITKGWI
jgi:DNA-binding CsgD family transcriptional regulator